MQKLSGESLNIASENIEKPTRLFPVTDGKIDCDLLKAELGDICEERYRARRIAQVLDVFAGSGTTAHAVMKLNAVDGGNRGCINVQLSEPTDEKSEAYKTAYVISRDALAALKEGYEPEVMRVVFKDASFKDDVVRTNAIQILKQQGIDDVKSV